MISSAHLYSQIESKFGFTLPEEYKLLNEQGRFKLDKPASNDELLDASYMWLSEMEWRNLEDVRDHEFPSYCLAGFISFAFTGGGDDWCWYPAASNGRHVPVVRCPRDNHEAEFYAPDFISAVYRRILDFCCNGFEDTPTDRNYLNRWHRDLGPLIPAQWQKTLASLTVSPMKTYQIGRFPSCGLLTPEDFDAILARDLEFNRLYESFRWMED